ncbi:MAG: tetratricopeptide repeat-containing protein, partial [Pyrinomonadaceae bacterium]
MCADRSRKTCFVIMGFGKKTDFATGRTLNLDATYQNIIKPAAEDAGLVCMRADELAHSGLLDAPLYEQLLTADLVIADISTSNMNVLYELGVRHALRPYATIVIAEDNLFAAPFDVTTVNILRYRHMGEDIGYAEVQRFRKVLTERILELTSSAPPQLDSPVYTFLNNLTPPATAAATRGVAEAVALPDDSFAGRLDQAKEAQKRGDFATAKALLEYVRGAMKKEDPYVIQQLALVTYKSRLPTPLAALEEARELLLTLAPVTSNDTETLGLWGAVHKRLWELTKESAHLDEA